MQCKNVYIVAGPNGAGKTTFAREFLPFYAHCPNFVNADLIAQGLSPFAPRAAAIKAGKLVLGRIRELSEAGTDFGFETTLAGRTYLHLFRQMKSAGYKLHFFFLWIPGQALAVSRIRDRVASGGHDVPAEDIKRRFIRSISNFFGLYKPLASSWMLFNNSGTQPVLIAKGMNGNLTVTDNRLFRAISGQGEK